MIFPIGPRPVYRSVFKTKHEPRIRWWLDREETLCGEFTMFVVVEQCMHSDGATHDLTGEIGQGADARRRDQF
jgi:hypothetical protein